MTGNEIREKYLAFMTEKGHAVVPSAALVPDNDPTTLFTGSGMQPLVPYLMGETHPKGTRITDSQKCFRAEDIEEVGDTSHTTFFEMLGNWSLGDYFKQEQIPWIAEFYLDKKWIGLDAEKFYVTAFIGDEAAGVPKDTEAVELWQGILAERGVNNGVGEMGSADNAATRGMKTGERIFYYDAKENWWSRAGVPDNMPIGEIGGGDSEMFYDFGTPHDPQFGEHCHPACDCGRFMEIGNSVFMEYIKTENGFQSLPAQNVDFGGGLERIAAASINSPDVYKIDLLWEIIETIQELSGKKYEDDVEAFRIVTDHIRGAVFMIGDGVLPGNTEQNYFVRRLLRRAVRYADKLGFPEGQLRVLAWKVIETYHNSPFISLQEKEIEIAEAIASEEAQFRKTLENGLKQFNKISLQVHITKEELAAAKETGEKLRTKGLKSISAQNAFDLFTTYGFPIELTEEIAEEKGLIVDKKGFTTLMAEHRAKSRAGAEQKFKGGLADSSDTVVQYHTATHLLLAGLRKFLGNHIHQAGSNITGERLRFDFTHSEKVERDQLDEIEIWVNEQIANGGEVTIETIAKTDAEADPTVEGSFWDRYPDEVKVYTMKLTDGTVVSRELCGGPHVENLTDLTPTFKIKKEESSSAGVRRIKAVLQTQT